MKRLQVEGEGRMVILSAHRDFFAGKECSGDWKNYFNDEIKGKFKEFCGTYVTGMGYESSDNW